MVWLIMKKEILENITSLRFVLTLLLVMIVFIVSGLVFVNKYKQGISDFSAESNKNLTGLREASENLSSVALYVQIIHPRPKLTQVFCEGHEKSLPNTFMTDAFSIQNPQIVGRTNYFFPRFADIDWVFIISLILSFVALLQTFDCFSAEKEQGTLLLVLSNSIPRDKMILGKYISAILTLIIPLIIGLLANLIIVSVYGLAISNSQWLKITLFMGASILYLSIFILLGMLISSRCKKSSSSIVMLLFIWVVLVMVIPACGRIVSERFVNVPNRPEWDRRIREAGSEIWDNSERYGKDAGNWAGGNEIPDWVNPPARSKLYNALTDSENRINEEYVNQIIAQVHFGRNITKISPVIIYQSASEAIIGSGVSRFRNIYDQLKRYKKELRDFIIDTDKSDPNSWHLLTPRSHHSQLISQKPVEYNAIPKFNESDDIKGEVLKKAMWDVGILILFNIFLFMAVYVSFLRCDVR